MRLVGPRRERNADWEPPDRPLGCHAAAGGTSGSHLARRHARGSHLVVEHLVVSCLLRRLRWRPSVAVRQLRVALTFCLPPVRVSFLCVCRPPVRRLRVMSVGLSGQLTASVPNALGSSTLTSSTCVTWAAAHPCGDQGRREVLGLHREFSGHRFDLVRQVRRQGDGERQGSLVLGLSHGCRPFYDRNAFGSAYSSLEDDIIDMLPSTMKAGGQVYTPYSCLAFDVTPDGTSRDGHRAHRRAGGGARLPESLMTGAGTSRLIWTTSRSRPRP